MKIKIDTKLLSEQMLLLESICNFASLSNDQLDLIDGLQNLLGEINCVAEDFEKVDLEVFASPEVPNGRMTIRELMSYDIDIDIANNVTDSLGMCLCCPVKLTDEGKYDWHDVLNYVVDVYGDDNYAECIVDDEEPEIPWNKKLRRLNNFLNSAAGYCSEENYEKWFLEE
jgi:hypothetical protein